MLTFPLLWIGKCSRRGLHILCCLTLSAVLFGCDGPQDSSKSIQIVESESILVATGDIDKIVERGFLRAIAPRTDGEQALSVPGIPVQAYPEIIEAFADELGVELKWHFVPGFDELLPALESGHGDVIVTNLTVTDQRAERVAFTTPIAKVSEVLITRRQDSVGDLADFTEGHISVPPGTAYANTLTDAVDRGQLKPQHVHWLPAGATDQDQLDAVSEGRARATVVDSDIARALLKSYTDLQNSMTVRQRRNIAWAVRDNNPELLRALNEFMVSHHVRVSSQDIKQRDWAAIKGSGRLRMLTLNNPASYFMYRGEMMGFDYELLRFFAKQHKLHVSVIVKDDMQNLFEALKQGEGDVIAASITHTPEREAQGLHFSRRYLYVKEQLVGRKGGPSIDDISELPTISIGVDPQTSYYQTLLTLQEQLQQPLQLVEVSGSSTEEMLTLLEEGRFDATVADSHLVAMEQTYHDQLNVLMDLTEQRDIAWVVRPDQTQLMQQLNRFIGGAYRGLEYNITVNKYFNNKKRIKQLQDGRITASKQLSKYDHIVQPLAAKHGMDWRLLTAQMYQESQFNPKAVSFAGAKGLMQLMPRTAKELGVSNLFVPENAILAGVKYMDWLQDRFPDPLSFEERVYFTLAAYNVGAGHVRDARKLARQQGLDPNRWFGNVEKAMLMLSKKAHYQNARYGYVRGREPVEYVRNIRDRYLGYLQVTSSR